MANVTKVVFGPQPAGFGNRHVMLYDLTIDTYTASTGRVDLTLPSGMTDPRVFCQADGGYTADYDKTNKKIILYKGGTETTLSSTTVHVTVMVIGQ